MMISMSEHEIAAAGYHAVVSATGAGLRVLRRGGVALTETWAPGTKPPLAAGLVLFPWPNRTRDGRFTFDGAAHQLELSEPELHNASHGLVRARDWELVDAGEAFVEQAVEVGGEPGWPFPLRHVVRHEVGPDGLTATHRVTNTGAGRAPFGLGIHTFLRAGDAPMDDCTLQVPASRVQPVERQRNLPEGPVRDVTPEEDLREPRGLDGLWFDTPFTGLAREGDGRARCWLRAPDGTSACLWTSAELGWVQVFTADPRNDKAYPGRGRALAVEPMSCPPDALASGDDLVVLEAGASWTAQWGISGVLPS
jgi:aldose 1-epimerase